MYVFINKENIILLTLKSVKKKIEKNPKFHFVKYSKTNDTVQKYCLRNFIFNGHTI